MDPTQICKRFLQEQPTERSASGGEKEMKQLLLAKLMKSLLYFFDSLLIASLLVHKLSESCMLLLKSSIWSRWDVALKAT